MVIVSISLKKAGPELTVDLEGKECDHRWMEE
jgi:hypothetical protein